MMKRSIRLAFVLLLVPLIALPQTDGSEQDSARARAALEVRMRSLEAALGRIRTEQQAVYQQFQMVQELRRSESQELAMPPQLYSPPVTPPNYDDVVRERQARESRLQNYATQMERLYNRYRELEEQARAVQQQLAELSTQR